MNEEIVLRKRFQMDDDIPLLPPPARPLPPRRFHWKFRNHIIVLIGLFTTSLVGITLLSLYNYSSPLLILISLDGTKPEYLYRNVTPTLQYLASTGLYGTMIPSFPSITFPNHYTLVTGLYPSYHGIVGNTFKDPKYNTTFTYVSSDRNPEPHWWIGEPIWTRLEKRFKTAMIYWPGSEAPHDGVYASYFHKYNVSVTLDEKLDWVFGYLDMPKRLRLRFIGLYIPDIDHVGHEQGPDSPQVNEVLSFVDSRLKMLLDGIRLRGLESSTTIVVVSDHGMTPTSVQKVLFLDDFISIDSFWFIDNGPVVFIYPNQTKDLETVYQSFKDGAERTKLFQVWKKEEIPEEYHYTSDRVSPIVLMAQMGYSFATRYNWNPETPPFPKGGSHGYNISDPSMHAIYIANGPTVRKGELGLFHNTEVYQTLGRLQRQKWEPRNGTSEFMNYFESFLRIP